MEEWQKSGAKDALIAEYAALRAEIVQRIRSQNVVLGWVVALVGATIGVLLKSYGGGADPPLLKLLTNPDISSIGFLAVLSAGFATGVEILMTYWVYQLFMAFRISNYLPRLQSRLEDLLDSPEALRLLSWDSDSRGLSDVMLKNGQQHPPLVRFSLKISAWTQPMSMFILAGISLVVMGFSLWSIFFKIPVFPFKTKVSLCVVFFLLMISLIIIGLLFIGLHKWILGWTGLPHAALHKKAPHQVPIERNRTGLKSGHQK